MGCKALQLRDYFQLIDCGNGVITNEKRSYDSELPLATTISINGVINKLDYSTVQTQTLMEATYGNARIGRDPMLASIQKANMSPAKYTYNPDGYLNSVSVGRNVKKFIVDHEKVSERRAYLGKIDQMKKGKMAFTAVKRKHIAGRLLRDENFLYSYPSKGIIRLTNRARQNSEYRYDRELGILQVENFAGQTRSYYYFRRYNVAYNGKLRKIADDSRKLDLVLYKYFPKSGLLKSAKHFNDITMSYEFDEQGNMTKVLRSVKGAKAQAMVSFAYDKNGNRTAINRLDEKGAVYTSTKLEYDKLSQAENIGNNYNEKSSSFSYNKFGYITKVSDGFNESNLEYDKYNRLTESFNADGVKTTYKYKSSGALSRITVSHEDKELSKQIFRYNRNGMLRSVKDAQGRKVSVKRDKDNRIVEKKLTNGTSIKYAYDKLGRLRFVVDQNKHKINFVFNKFNKLAKRITPSGQLSDWKYDKFGQVASLTDSKDSTVGRKAKYTYNKIGQLLEVVYADNSRKSFTYNDLGKTISVKAFDSEGKKSETSLKYNFFERVTSKRETVGERKIEYIYTYNKANQRTAMQVKRGNGVITNEKRSYDSIGRLVTIANNGNQSLSYEYNIRGRISKQRANGIEINFSYDKLGRLKTKILGLKLNPISKIEYFYGANNQIAAREVNGIKQAYQYDQLGQLLSVTAGASLLEQYKYDLAGNMLSKTIDGKTTTYKYDESNQLASSTVDGKTTTYQYDAAGRMTQEGDTSYSYNFANKVVKAGENTYNYYANGQLANASVNGKNEEFSWDGLALLQRNGTNYLNEPYATGGNPVLAGKKVLFNDMLGTTQGSITKNEKYQATNRTAFGAGDKSGFFTGKPHVEGLGSVFLFRNYRPNQAKWTSSDPIGYPDGWNNFAYVNNNVTSSIDMLGLCTLGQDGYIPCSTGGAFASSNITSTFSSTNSYTAECGSSISSSKSFSFSISVTIQGVFGLSATYTTSITVTASLTGDPHDGTGGGSITVSGKATYVYYNTGWEYSCGRKENVTSHQISSNIRAVTSAVPCTPNDTHE